MPSSRETRPLLAPSSFRLKPSRNSSYLFKIPENCLVALAGILFIASLISLANVSVGEGSFVKASKSTPTSELTSSSPPPPRLPEKPDIYDNALKYLVSKRRRHQEQQLLHKQVLQLYKQQHLPHHHIPSPPSNLSQLSQYTFVEVNKTTSSDNDAASHKNFTRRSDDFYETSPNAPPSSSAEEAHAKILIQAKELNDLSSQLVELSLDTNGTLRSQNGRSLGSSSSSIFSRFANVLDLGRVVREIETSVMSSVSCTACKAGMGMLHHYINSGRSNEEIASAAIKLCMNLKMQTPRVCSGIINLYVDEIVEVLKDVVIDSNDICALVIGESCGEPVSPTWKWSVAFPPIPKPAFHGFPDPKPGAPRLKVLQISDTHWDPFYEPGTNADCNEPLCCRLTSGPQPPRPHLGAGLWGDYRKCDTPRSTMESMFHHISTAHSDIDYILWTGDIPAHDVWNQTHDGNLQIIKETVDLFTQYFPYTPIFPALGNHESSPVNSFAPPWVKDSKFSIDWLYKALQEDWARWLPDTTFSTIREGAFYSTLIKPGFKLISLNTNYCNNKNWWLLVNSTDPVDELKWLIFELQSSELASEKVHIIGHIPPGHADCMATWSKNYNKIISRYESTITGQFFGHTHFDELEIFYSKEDPYRASNVAYVGPSVTPYYNLNPGYRIYYVDGDHDASTRAVVDHETWVTNLGEANRVRASHLTWFKLYSAKEAYGLPSLNPLHWDDLIMSMYKDKRLFQTYYRFYNKDSPVAPSCDDECRTRILCDARSGRSHAREELCKPRPIHVRSSRGGLAESNRPPSKMAQLFSMISSAVSSLMGYLAYPFGYG